MGGMPVVAHPPCRSWSQRLWKRSKGTVGEKALAPLCVEFVRSCGGVLEHPAFSRLWGHCSLPQPGYSDEFGFTFVLDQSWFGFPARKRTWLYICGVDPGMMPGYPFALGDSEGNIALMSHFWRSHTVPALAAWLVELARNSSPAKPVCDVGPGMGPGLLLT